MPDIIEFMRKNGYKYEQDVEFLLSNRSNPEAVIVTYKSIEVIQKEMMKQPDSHVMIETIAPEEEYAAHLIMVDR